MEIQKAPNSQNNQKKEKLQYMGSQRVGYDLATKYQQILIYMYKAMYICNSIKSGTGKCCGMKNLKQINVFLC